ncbi:MAG: glycosyltransferase family 1 protein, partial [Bacteroidota bacterium]
YSRTLLQHVSQGHPDWSFHLFGTDLDPSAPWLDQNFHLHSPQRGRLLWRRWRIVQDLVRSELDIYHGLSHELPWGIEKLKLRTVVSMHDVIFQRYPGHYPLIDRLIYDKKWQHSCKVADVLVAISDATRQDLIEFYGVPEDRIKVIYQSLSPRYQDQAARAALLPLGLPKDYLLFVGSLTPRKNLLGLLKALLMLPKGHRPPLVVVGKGKVYGRQMMAYLHRQGLGKEVYFRSEMGNEELPSVYAQALGLVYPSFYEGFGLPIVEALSQGTPVITSRFSAMPEAAGPGALLMDPHDPADIARAIIKLRDDEALRFRLVQEGQRYIQRFSPAIIAQQWTDLYGSL